MGRDKALILVIFVMFIIAGVAFYQFGNGQITQDDPGADGTPVITEAPAVSTKPGEFRGIALQLHNPSPEHPYEEYIREIADTGANTVALVLPGYQENASSTSIFVEARKVPSPARIRELIAFAKRKLGMKVILMPIVLLENPKSGEWRGKIVPESWPAWWEDYNNYILYYAGIAQQADADVLMVGSELVKTEAKTANWIALIQQVRKVYNGRLSYSANWDHYRPVQFWEYLDLVGMTTYYDLQQDRKPTLENLQAEWMKIRKDVLDWQAKINRPILFTEVGWPNQETAAKAPWNYYGSQTPAPKLQANCFEAFFRTWINQPAVAGFIAWEWQNYPGQATGPKDTSYIPKGKPAETVIRRYYQAAAEADARAATQPQSAPPTTATSPAD